MKPVLAIDAKATEHILHRKGIADVPYWWMQNEVRSKMLRVVRVKSEENVANLGTQPLINGVITEHCFALGCVNMDEESV